MLWSWTRGGESRNPHLLKAPGQWRDLWAGDVIHFPEAWTDDEIDRARAKYRVEPERPVVRAETPGGVDEQRARRLSGHRLGSLGLAAGRSQSAAGIPAFQ